MKPKAAPDLFDGGAAARLAFRLAKGFVVVHGLFFFSRALGSRLGCLDVEQVRVLGCRLHVLLRAQVWF